MFMTNGINNGFKLHQRNMIEAIRSTVTDLNLVKNGINPDLEGV